MKLGQDILNKCFISETLEDLKGRLEAWKGALELKGSRLNVKKTKMVKRSENVGKITEESKFFCTVCRKDIDSISILCTFCRCYVHKRCICISGKLKADSLNFRHTLIITQT